MNSRARVVRASRGSLSPLLAALLVATLASPAGAQLLTFGNKQLYQGSPGVDGSPELGDDFGRALAVGDFDCDGYDDLAVGVPWEDSDVTHSGAVNVFYGGPAGLSSAELWDQSDPWVPGENEAHDHFGAALAAIRTAFFDCDHLAVGAPDEDINGVVDHVNAGAVFVFGGQPDGLHANGIIVQGQNGVPESPEDDDRFGAAISQGPVVDSGSVADCPPGSDGDQTMVIGAPGEGLGIGDNGDGLLVQVVLPCNNAGGGGELPSIASCNAAELPTDCRTLSADDFGLPLNLNPYDGAFGSSLALVARAVPEGYPELGWELLAIGVPYANNGAPVSNSGAVLELDPSLDDDDSFYWQQGNNGIAGAPETGDHFGQVLAAGDFDDDGRPDLVVGVPDEDVGTTEDAGVIQVIRNSSTGLTGTGDQLIDQGDIAGVAIEANDRFGSALAVGDFDGDGVDDLAVGVEGENLSSPRVVVNAGAVNVLYGVDGAGLSTSGAQHFDGDDLFFNGAHEQSFFGSALAAGDFDGNGVDDLAIGEPGSQDLLNSYGYVYVLYGARDGALGGVGFGANDLTRSESAGTIQLELERTGSAIDDATVGVRKITGGTATPGSDYDFTSASVHWNVGEIGAKSFSFPILNDSEAELSETVVLELYDYADDRLALEGPGQVTLTITDNEPPSVEMEVASASISEDGGTLQLHVLRTGVAGVAATVDWVTASLPATSVNSATGGLDYIPAGGQLSWALGDRSMRTISITIVPESTAECAEMFDVKLLSPVGVLPASPVATRVTIPANDGGIFCDGFLDATTDAWSDVAP